LISVGPQWPDALVPEIPHHNRIHHSRGIFQDRQH
jgi:hypothetical protein